MPIKFGKHLVSKLVDPVEMPFPTDFSLKVLEMEDLQRYTWLVERVNQLEGLLSNGHLGVIMVNNNKACVGYCFVGKNRARPSHIHKIPKNAVWIHYWRVKDDYQGMGLGRQILAGTVSFVQERWGLVDVYIDTSEDNIPSRINQMRLGFFEQGVYYSIRLGTKRVPSLHFQWGVWLRNKRHSNLEM